MKVTKWEAELAIRMWQRGEKSIDELLPVLGFDQNSKLYRNHLDAVREVEISTVQQACEALGIELPEDD